MTTQLDQSIELISKMAEAWSKEDLILLESLVLEAKSIYEGDE